MTNSYDDIIHLPRHSSATHPQMPIADRAAQFSPFAALTGYDAAVKEAARLTDKRLELDDGVKEGVFSMPDTDITALVLHHALKGLEVPYIRGIMGDNISQRIKRRDNVMNLIFNGIKIK